MIDLDRIEGSCDALIKQGFGWNNPACTSASTVKEIITRLRQAEKDAARYKSQSEKSESLISYVESELSEALKNDYDRYCLLDGVNGELRYFIKYMADDGNEIDEAMRCK